MFAAHCHTEDLEEALDKLNEKYEGNITFTDTCDLSSCIFALICKDSDELGANLYGSAGYELNRIKNPQKRIAKACYHVYKDFINLLFEKDSEIRVYNKGTTISPKEPYSAPEEWCQCLVRKEEKAKGDN